NLTLRIRPYSVGSFASAVPTPPGLDNPLVLRDYVIQAVHMVCPNAGPLKALAGGVLLKKTTLAKRPIR
ncbi:MAG: hypothetical protein ACE5FB_04235, partial [Candidatus Binatia bacterium]